MAIYAIPASNIVKKQNIMSHNINFLDKLIPFSKLLAEIIIILEDKLMLRKFLIQFDRNIHQNEPHGTFSSFWGGGWWEHTNT